MAAECKVTTNITLTGLGSENQLKNTFNTNTTPAEIVESKPVISTTIYHIDYGSIDADDAFSLYLKALAGNVYIGINVSAALSTAGQLYIPEGESTYLPLNIVLSADIYALGSDADSQLEYMVVGD